MLFRSALPIIYSSKVVVPDCYSTIKDTFRCEDMDNNCNRKSVRVDLTDIFVDDEINIINKRERGINWLIMDSGVVWKYLPFVLNEIRKDCRDVEVFPIGFASGEDIKKYIRDRPNYIVELESVVRLNRKLEWQNYLDISQL